MERAVIPPPSRRRSHRIMPIVVLLAMMGAGAAWWWHGRPADEAPAAPTPAAAPLGPAAVATSEPPSAPSVAEPAPVAQPLSQADLPGALGDLIGRDAVLRFLQLDAFPRYLVATLDNLPRDHAPAAVWPVRPTGGRIVLDERDGRHYIAEANGARYAPFVQLATSIDAGRLADFYMRALPLLQQAYEELGYPGHRVHARVIAVIDHLLALPVPDQPLEVTLTSVKGPMPLERPWVHWEFADPTLERASAGRKLLLRMGPGQQRRLQSKLGEFRQALVERAPR